MREKNIYVGEWIESLLVSFEEKKTRKAFKREPFFIFVSFLSFSLLSVHGASRYLFKFRPKHLNSVTRKNTHCTGLVYEPFPFRALILKEDRITGFSKEVPT